MTRIRRQRRPGRLAGMLLPLALAAAFPAMACQGNFTATSADSCFAMRGCTWNKTRAACEVRANVNALDGDERFSFQGDHFSSAGNEVERNRAGIRSPMPADFESQRLGRVCPDPVIDAVRHIDEAPGPVTMGSPSQYFTWQRAHTIELMLRMRAGWLALREEGACRKALRLGMLPEAAPADSRLDLRLTLSNQARHNWKLARRGNPFNGVIDCTNWRVHLLPHNARASESADQVPWTLDQLRKARWSQARPKLKLSDRELVGMRNNGIDHGRVAALVRGHDRPAATFEAWCVEERQVKADFLGFTVWPSQKDGSPTWKLTSRQLNGPNLDRMTVIGLTADGRLGPGANLADPQGRPVYGGALQFLPDQRAKAIDPDLKTVIGGLPLPLSASLVRLGNDRRQMPPPRR
ncbi:hypothetical protein [Geminicoccus roseus]|uniref:hypothetical protein n=1 Tax=Geminicoccus roseus TaxID=404900 RepID=UPI0012FCECA0|nr:hypothetical protein [Geminicoccus roseus]